MIIYDHRPGGRNIEIYRNLMQHAAAHPATAPGGVHLKIHGLRGGRTAELRGKEMRLDQGVACQRDHGHDVQKDTAGTHVAVHEETAQDALGDCLE